MRDHAFRRYHLRGRIRMSCPRHRVHRGSRDPIMLFVQSAAYLAIYQEMMHEVRIIPLGWKASSGSCYPRLHGGFPRSLVWRRRPSGVRPARSPGYRKQTRPCPEAGWRSWSSADVLRFPGTERMQALPRSGQMLPPQSDLPFQTVILRERLYRIAPPTKTLRLRCPFDPSTG